MSENGSTAIGFKIRKLKIKKKMTNCGYKIQHTCGTKQKAVCVYYDTTLPDFSSLKDETCVTVEEAISDLYKLIKKLRENSDLSELGTSCIKYGVGNDKLTPKLVLKELEKELCLLKGSAGSGSSSSGLNFDLKKIEKKCLENACGGEIKSLEGLLQAIIDKICVPPIAY